MSRFTNGTEGPDTEYRPLTDAGEPSGAPAILLVSADRATRGTLERALRDRGFVVWVAANGAEAVALGRSLQGRVDVAVTDSRLRDTEGTETLNALRAIAPRVRCCVVTSDPRLSSLTHLFMQGAKHVFLKPLSVGAVAASLSLLAELGP